MQGPPLDRHRTARRQLLAGLGAVAALPLLPRGLQAAGGATTLELFTSQGCSSCPPADRLLAELAERPDVVALSFHVPYWDYIGWSDPYADAGCLERQERYRSWLHSRFLYTPQMVIGGRFDVVGSRRGEVLQRLEDALAMPQLALRLAEAAGGGRQVRLPESATAPRGAQLLAFDYLPRAETEVARGENAGRTLVERNIVRRIRSLAEWHGQADAVALPPPAAGLAQAVLLQDQASGAVLGAAKHEPAG